MVMHVECPNRMTVFSKTFMQVSFCSCAQASERRHCNIVSHWLGTYTKWPLSHGSPVMGCHVSSSFDLCSRMKLGCIRMTSSNGNIFRVTGHVCGEFPSQRPVTRSFDVFFDLRLNKRLSKQSWGWWFETLSRPSWRHCNDELPEQKWLVLVTTSGAVELCQHCFR